METRTILRSVIYIFAVLGIAFVLATIAWKWADDLLALDKPEASVSVSIEEDESIAQIATDLAEKGLIKYKPLFCLFATMTGKTADGKIVPGEYHLDSSMDYSALLTSIGPRSRARETVTVAIPEGYTAAEIFELLEKSKVCNAQALSDEAKKGLENYKKSFFFLEGCEDSVNCPLEGFLFPDTYEFYTNETPETVLSRLLTNFDNHLSETMREQIDKSDYSCRELVTIASIVEKETDGSDRKNIASVIINRLEHPEKKKIKGYLQMDSTVQYALPKRKERLDSEDLAVDSPYNTYQHKGLPVGPICSPGTEALDAAIAPADTDYYYFVVGDDGKTHFFKTSSGFEEFRDKQEWRMRVR